MKVKKIILTMVSALIIVAIAMQSIVLATTPLPDASTTNPLVLLNLDIALDGEEDYSINGDTTNAIKMHRIAKMTSGDNWERIKDAYCAWADKGFEDRTDYSEDSNHKDTYTAKYYMNDSEDRASIISEGLIYEPNTYVDADNQVTKYDAILQLLDMFFIQEDTFSDYKSTTLKNAINYGNEENIIAVGYDQLVNAETSGVGNVFINEKQIRAVQQAALWYFTSYGDTLYNYYGTDCGWLYVKDSVLGTPTQVANIKTTDEYERPFIDQEAQSLYNYLIDTAIENAKANKEITNNIYLYSNLSEKDTTQTIIMITRENKEFDLALRKFTTKINGNDVNPSREPDTSAEEDLTGDIKPGEKTAKKEHTKNKIAVKKGDRVLYTIRVYNEGEVDGYAKEVTDYLPEGLTFVPKSESEINTTYGWNVDTTGRIVTTDYLKDELIPAANRDWSKLDDKDDEGKEITDKSQLCYRDLLIECTVNENATSKNLRNIAEITNSKGKNGEKDKDSDTGNVDRPDYKPTHPTTGRGEEDDDDFEDLTLNFDLALRKNISKITDSNGTVIKSNEELGRTPVVDESTLPLTTGEMPTTATYNHKKDPVLVQNGYYVYYTLSVYNEGDIDGNATQIKDQLPAGLVAQIADTDGIVSDTFEYESYDTTNNVLILKRKSGVAVQKSYESTKLDQYKETVTVKCKVDTTKSGIFTNIAWISGYYNNDEGIVTEDLDSVSSTPTVKPSANELVTNNIGYTGKKTWTEAELANNSFFYGQEDDDDFEKIRIQALDLALRKFITKVADNKEMTGATEYDRAPNYTFDTPEKFINGEITTATYNHTKQPVKVNAGDYVEYILRIYNEGSMDGYAREITDHLPEYLEYVDCEANNTKYKWNVSEDGRTVTTNYLKDTKLNAVSFETWDGGGYPTGRYYNGDVITLDSTEKLQSNELKIICKVKDTVPCEKNQTNIAEISLYGFTTDNGNTIVEKTVDRDSQTTDGGEVKLPSDTDLPNYRKSEIDAKIPYIPGQQDDDDFEKVYVPKFDLALRKFITKVETEAGIDRYAKADYDARVPQISGLEDFVNGKTTTLTYSHSKEPMYTVKTDVVTYTLRIFNEGNMDGYASVITDDIPEGLVFLPDNETNKKYGWKMFTELPEGATAEAGKEMVELNVNGSSEVKKYIETNDASKAKIIRTTYLSYENGREENLIKAFDSSKGITDTNPDYKDVQVAFKVTEDYGSDRILINYAQISDDQDDEGKPVKDIDSTPDIWKEGEDDQDIEKLKVPQFDLALRKWVTQAIVTENGKTTVTETGHQPFDDPEDIVKVELHRKKLSNVTVKFRYSIRVYNDGYDKETGEALPGHIAGYAKEVKDHIPAGLKFLPEDNPDWTVLEDNVITTRKLENTLLQPGEYADVEVVLTWINGNDNLGLKVNYAEISEDYNDWGVPDKDSTPDNIKERHEDDDDEAPVMLSVSTGAVETYMTLGLVVLITIAGGIVLIKKYVM